MSSSAASALDAYTMPIIHAIKTIIRGQILVSTESEAKGLTAELRLAPGPFLEVKSSRGHGHLWIGCRHRVHVVQGDHTDDSFTVSIPAVTYQLFRGDGRTQFDEIVAYHWTPNDPSAKRTWPHLHIGSAFIDPAARREPMTLHKTHFLTGAISAAGFVRMAIEEFGIVPVVADWQERIALDTVPA